MGWMLRLWVSDCSVTAALDFNNGSIMSGMALLRCILRNEG